MVNKIIIIVCFLFFPFSLCSQQWQSLQSQHFMIHFTQSDKKVALRTIQIAEESYQTITADIGFTVDQRTFIFIFPSRKEFELANKGVQKQIVGQACVGKDNIIVIQSPKSNLNITLEKTIRHELTHIVLGAVFKKGYLPRWLNEGLAMYEAKEWQLVNNMYLGQAYLTDKLLPFSSLTYTFPRDDFQTQLAYAQSFDIVLFMINRYGKEKVIKLIKELSYGTEFNSAFNKSFGMDFGKLETNWYASLKKRFNWVSVVTSSYLLWLIFPVLCLVVYMIKRHQVKKKIREWEEEDNYQLTDY
ncbi:MAG: peptidase MA family metallohydrolase [bacterium]